MQAPRFTCKERVRARWPVGWLNSGSQGTVVRVFFGMDAYAVRFDNQTSIRVVSGQELESISRSSTAS